MQLRIFYLDENTLKFVSWQERQNHLIVSFLCLISNANATEHTGFNSEHTTKAGLLHKYMYNKINKLK